MTDAPPKTPGVAAQVRTFFTGECKIFIARGNRMKRATWNVSFDHDDLKRLHEEGARATPADSISTSSVVARMDLSDFQT